MPSPDQTNGPAGLLRFTRALGPAIIVACVVLGPGSILTSSKVGCQFGYELSWILVGAGILMAGAVATAARVGISLEGTPCNELATRLGRPVAALAGISVFLIAACFQFSNNLGVLASIEPLVESGAGLQHTLLIGLNAALIACLFGFKKLYQPIERLMMLLVGLMLIGFAANLLLARPSLLNFLAGLLPGIPDGISGGFLPVVQEIKATTANDPATHTVVDPWIAVQGLIATTFSIAGAFYQSYLVKEKGWKLANLRQGLTDSVAGITVLLGITMMILVTSASVLSGNVAPADLQSVADVAKQLEPLFGSTAKLLFCLGIFAGALSSFLVNSLIGGTLLADGLGLEAKMDSKWPKLFTIGVLMIGMVIALTTSSEGRVPLIIFAQAATVLGGPVLALSLLYLALRPSTTGAPPTPTWMIGLTSLGTLVICTLAVRTAWTLFLKFQILIS
ncbi:MAG: divalent metal cation transporter [Planctomycetales bacterium]|nr:divalent metal cation transporter [Planctomycetales bacterium]